MIVFLEISLILLIYATSWFLLSVLFRRNDIADIAWGIGYMLIGGYLLLYHNPTQVTKLAILLVTLWATRLSFYIFRRNKGKKEDFRYKKWRDEWGSSFYYRSYLQVFLLQAFFLLLIISPIVNSTLDATISFSWISVVALVGWLVGFYWQVVGDWQLAKFVHSRTSNEQIMSSGLWRYSRHPNYFGEVVMWWSIYLLLIPSSNSLWFMVGPLTITLLIRYVSGVPMLEARYKDNLAYQKYKKSVPTLLPKLLH